MSPVGFVQDHYPVQITAALGESAVLVETMEGEESISGLYTFRLRLVSENATLAFDDIVGKDVSLSMLAADGTAPRFVHGIVGRFVQAGSTRRLTTYFADVHPKMWLLTKTADSRIFQNKTVPDIVKQILTDHGVTDVRDALTATYTPREYCVQYRETNFNFVSRLMESEGICYWFEHTSDAHTLVLADAGSSHAGASVSMSVSATEVHRTGASALVECAIEAQVTAGKCQLDDYNFETPATDLLGVAEGSDPTLSVYDYPAGTTVKDAVESMATRRLEALEVPKRLLRASSNNADVRAGGTVTVADHARDDTNGGYVVWTVSHQANQDSYSNAFVAFPSDTVFRPPLTTAVPRIYGCQTATVVGKPGEEITTDEYGRVKVKFHWDQSAVNDDTSSCWIRVAQTWAGKGFGAFFLPRIGQEVVVSFLDGDPDRPLITGSVYNGQQTVPYALPDNQTRSLVKTGSSKGGGGFNEIRFEDKKDSEELFIQAQKDMMLTVLNDQTATIKQNRVLTVEEGDETLSVKKGKRTLAVKGDETHTNSAKLTYDITDDLALKVGGKVTLTITGDLTLDVTGKVQIKATGAIASESSQDVTVKAGMNLTQEAGMAMNSKGGTTHNVESGGVLIIKGSLVKVN